MSIITTVRTLYAAVAVVVLGSGMGFAQAPTGQISGRVTDSSGGVLPGVTVTVTQTDTGLVRSVVSNETGAYAVPSLPVGPYQFEAALTGFRTFSGSGVSTHTNIAAGLFWRF